MSLNIDIEKWVPIFGWEGCYEISNFGRVKSLERKVKSPHGGLKILRERILKPYINKLGYCMVGLHIKGETSMYLIHRLVCSHFLPNEENKPQVNHKDGNPSNNHIDNLEWCTSKENIIHGWVVLKRKPSGAAAGHKWSESKKGLNHKRIGRFNKNPSKGGSHYMARKVICSTLGLEFDTIVEAAKALGFNPPRVGDVLRGRARHADGLTFRYLS